MTPEKTHIQQIAPCSRNVPVSDYNRKYFVKKEDNDVVKKTQEGIPRSKSWNGTMGEMKKTENVVQEKGHEVSKADIYLTI